MKNSTPFPNVPADSFAPLSADFLNLMFRSISDLVIVADLEGQIEIANPAAFAVLGYGPNDLCGRNVFEFFPQPHRDELREDWQRFLAQAEGTEPPAPWRVRAVRQDSTIAPVSISLTKLSSEPRRDEAHAGPRSRMVAVVRDISRILDIELALEKRTEELARTNLELQRFGGTVAHDLQAPLRTILSFTQHVLSTSSNSLPAESAEKLHRVERAALRMSGLLQSLLSLHRVQYGPVRLSNVNVQELVEEIRADMAAALAEAGARLSCGPLPIVHGDREQLRQLLQNLIGNAIKFRAPGRTPEVCVGGDSSGDEPVFYVRDNGIGIEPRFFVKIFESFQKLHSPSEYAGSGLGLSICQRIIERHGGRLWVESEPGKGTCFFFTLRQIRV